MSNAAKARFKQNLQQQFYKNYARHIQTKIGDARSSPEDAGSRWPFELLQNAHDAGLRTGKDCIEVSIGWTPDGDSRRLFFEHDGAPFSVDDITALQSGGSNKEFESAVTTGRFGTGFLVTHVLSPRTRVMGLLAVDEGLERFDLLLDRSGSEEAIIQNIMDCEEAIGRAELLQDPEGYASARFEYLVEEGSSLILGIEALRGTLPYLFSTCPLLRQVKLRRLDGVTEIWIGNEVVGHPLTEGYLHERPVHVMTIETSEVHELRSLRFSLTEHEKSSALVVLDQDGDSWAARIPDTTAARLYVRFPIRGTNELPFAFVLNGPFDVEPERRNVHLDGSKGLLRCALEVAPSALQYLTDMGVREAYRLATVCPLPPRVGDGTMGWWTEQLTNLAHGFSRLPIIETTSGLWPAVKGNDDDRFTDFIYPQIKADSPQEEVDIEMVWPLLAEMTDYAPPQKHLARSWTDIGKGWKALGVDVTRVSLEYLANYIRSEAKSQSIEELPLSSEVSRLEWLMMFLDVLGRCSINRGGFDSAILAGLLPNQKGDLCAPAELRKDAGIPEALKDIAEVLGDNIRARLLHQDLFLRASSSEGSNIQHVLDAAVQESMCESRLIEALIMRLEKGLQTGRKAAEADKALLDGSQRLLLYLWETQGAAAADVARQIPLHTLDNTCVRWDKEKMLMAPVPAWHEAARAYEFVYPRNRVLDARYHKPGNTSETDPLIDALVSWGIAYRNPLIRVTPTELKDRRLAALAERGTNTSGITLSGHEFSQIALLDNELINRCTNQEEGVAVARALLGLVLNYAAVHDPSWREFREVSGRQNRADTLLRVRQALWVAELKTRKWIPVLESDDQEVARADLTSLKTLLDPCWLSGNEDAIRLLSECFEFDSLEVRLLSLAQGEDRQREVRQSLASLLEKTSGSAESLQQLVRIATADINIVAQLVDAASEDSTVLAELTTQLQERKRRAQQVQRQREFGLAVQAAIKAALEARCLHVEVIDRGFDFAVSMRDSDDPEEVSAAEFVIGDRYLVEVKATTTDEVRMTAEQAKTAAGAGDNRYVLCVVALPETLPSGLPDEHVRKIVEVQARLLPDISCRIRTTWELVEQAKYGEIGIRNEKVLRYGIPRSAWTAGLTIEQWVSQIAVVLGSQG